MWKTAQFEVFFKKSVPTIGFILSLNEKYESSDNPLSLNGTSHGPDSPNSRKARVHLLRRLKLFTSPKSLIVQYTHRNGQANNCDTESIIVAVSLANTLSVTETHQYVCLY